jgi:hypothetical protein
MKTEGIAKNIKKMKNYSQTWRASLCHLKVEKFMLMAKFLYPFVSRSVVFVSRVWNFFFILFIMQQWWEAICRLFFLIKNILELKRKNIEKILKGSSSAYTSNISLENRFLFFFIIFYWHDTRKEMEKILLWKDIIFFPTSL